MIEAHEITWFLWEQLLFRETPQENVPWIKVLIEGWPKVLTVVRLKIPV
jgi:hypothetical protein